MKKTNHTQQLIDTFNALGDATRFKLLQLLIQDKELCVSELAKEVGISNAGASQQLKVLEHAGLVVRRRLGQKICYEIINEKLVNNQIVKIIKEV